MSHQARILLYHRVGIRDGSHMDKYTVSPDVFGQQMRWLRKMGWQAVALESAVDTGAHDPGARSFALTFDDGFASNRAYAWPVLAELGFPAATFLVTDHLGDSNRWDGPAAVQHPLLGTADLAAADPGLMTFHTHSASHPDLALLAGDPVALHREIRASRDRLAQLGCTGRFFAYPRGSWNWRVMEEVRNAGYAGACTCLEGLNTRKTNPFLLRRVEMRQDDLGMRLRAKLWSGRGLLDFPPKRPPEFALLAAWLRRGPKSQAKGARRS
jgi:peptidoglycan/xylan/chitin deacetylase (PgdA/CDA1 family)